MVAYTVMMMFLKSYERGESVYLSMASRGFSDKSQLYSLTKKEVNLNEYSFIITTLVLIICLQILAIFHLSPNGLHRNANNDII